MQVGRPFRPAFLTDLDTHALTLQDSLYDLTPELFHFGWSQRRDGASDGSSDGHDLLRQSVRLAGDPVYIS
jgi:hypothetical protein